MKTAFLTTACAASMFTHAASAATISLSSSKEDPNALVDLVLNIGEQADLFVWIQPDDGQSINGIALDVISSEAEVLEALNFVIENPTAGLGTVRWDETDNGTLGDLLTESNAVAVNQFGIQQQFAGFDQGIVVNGNFLHATLTIQATEEGTTRVLPAVGRREISDTTGVFTPELVGGTVEVVPEPASAVLIAAGTLMLARRRRPA